MIAQKIIQVNIFLEETKMIRLCAFADEADKMVDGQIAALKRNNIGLIELRGLDGVNIGKLSEDEAREYAKKFKKNVIQVLS